jgi:transcriptional regulator with GAF, ATPase, and Fis domain
MTSASRPIRDRLELLYRLSQTFNSTLDLDQVLNRLLDEVVVNLTAERGFVMLRDEQGRLAVRVARGLEHQTIQAPDFLFSQGVIDKVVLEGQPVLTHDASLDDRFNLRQSVVLHQLRSILCVPLRIQERTAGVIYVDNRAQAGIFTDGDLELLNAIAATAAIAIENARLYRVAVEKVAWNEPRWLRSQASLFPNRCHKSRLGIRSPLAASPAPVITISFRCRVITAWLSPMFPIKACRPYLYGLTRSIVPPAWIRPPPPEA